MSLAAAVRSLLDTRGLTVNAVGARPGIGINESTFRQIVAGRWDDPQVSTLVAICDALEVTPGELLQLSGLWDGADASSHQLDLRLRDALSRVAALDEERKSLALRLMLGVLSEIADPDSPPSRASA